MSGVMHACMTAPLHQPNTECLIDTKDTISDATAMNRIDSGLHGTPHTSLHVGSRCYNYNTQWRSQEKKAAGANI
jgi:hypothetical protein